MSEPDNTENTVASRYSKYIEDLKKCDHKDTEPHTCPYKEDINGDFETLCTCCPCQQHECAMDI